MGLEHILTGPIHYGETTWWFVTEEKEKERDVRLVRAGREVRVRSLGSLL